MVAISFIISTRNRAGPGLLRSLSSVTRVMETRGDIACELVVVDNGSTDKTASMLAAFAAQSTAQVCVLSEPRAGLARARNAAVAAAKGRLLAFTDDDCVLMPGYLDDLLRHDSLDSIPTLRGGRVSRGDPLDLNLTVKDRDTPHRLMVGEHPGTVVLGCNMVIPRRVFETIGDFDSRFGAGARYVAAEETDLVYRADRAGFPVEYVPDMRVLHFHGRRAPHEALNLEIGYCFGNGAFAAKWMMRDPRIARGAAWILREVHAPWRRRRLEGSGKRLPLLDAEAKGIACWWRDAALALGGLRDWPEGKALTLTTPEVASHQSAS